MRDKLYPYRVFISYHRPDRPIVEPLLKVLKRLGVHPMLDEQFTGGLDFRTQIKKFIENCHVFIPFLTPDSIHGPWTNQEVGWAVAMQKPILPVTIAGPPVGLIRDIQTISLKPDLSDVAKKITGTQLESAVNEANRISPTYEATKTNQRRAQILAEYANSVSGLGYYGTVRQRASLTSFHLPTQPPPGKLWSTYFADSPKDTDLFEALWDERQALEKHAARAGCMLIIDSFTAVERVYERHGRNSAVARARGLLEFLRSFTGSVQIVINNDSARTTSATLIGDWFLSEAVTSANSGATSGVLREALFTRHQTTVLKEVREFDNNMDRLLVDRGWTAKNSRSETIRYLERQLKRSFG